MNGKEILQKVLELYEDPSKWTQRTFAKDSNGVDCGIRQGCCWCLSGAIHFVAGDPWNPETKTAFALLHYALEQRGVHLSIPNFNDGIAKSVEDVKSLLLEAIRRAEDLELAA